MDDRPDEPKPTPSGADGRRALWSRRLAIALLVAFGMFVLFNLVAVLVLAYRSVMQGQGGPFP